MVDENDFTPRKISIVYGYVQMGRALHWQMAREELVKSVYAMFGRPTTGIGSVAIARTRHLERARTAPVEEYPAGQHWIWLADAGHTVWCAQEGDHGLTAGDLAIAHDCTNGARYAWTIDVKCRIVAVDGRRARIKITGESVQFTRGQETTVGIEMLKPRT